MGHMTVLVLLNDHLDDSRLHSNINEALEKVTHGEESHTVGGVKAFRSFHADETKIFVVGQNTARALLPSPQNVSSVSETQTLLRAMAHAHGFDLVERASLASSTCVFKPAAPKRRSSVAGSATLERQP